MCSTSGSGAAGQQRLLPRAAGWGAGPDLLAHRIQVSPEAFGPTRRICAFVGLTGEEPRYLEGDPVLPLGGRAECKRRATPPPGRFFHSMQRHQLTKVVYVCSPHAHMLTLLAVGSIGCARASLGRSRIEVEAAQAISLA